MTNYENPLENSEKKLNFGLKPIKFESIITINDVPIQWISTFELYYPDLPQFPIVYIHFNKNENRIYGFPVSKSFFIVDDRTCDVEFIFLCNKDLDKNLELKELVKSELEQRFGTKDRIGLNDIISCCNGNDTYINFFKELWKYFEITFGDFIPYGKFYEEIFSIVRFVSAWQPKTGRQSEMRMLYNFLSIFGEELEISGKWSYLQFFLLPTYIDVKNESLVLFKKFDLLYSTIRKVWKYFFTKRKNIQGYTFFSLEKSWPKKKEDFIREISSPLLSQKILNIEEKHSFDRLVDAFNRYSWRAAFFIFSIMTSFIKDYTNWDKQFFINFYLGKVGVGCSEKVTACFLQQGFKNPEAIPIDTWIEAFYQKALGIESSRVFFNTFSDLGKLERVMWKAGQFKKTNIKAFFDILWCIRYGDTGNNELRGANPIACYTCKLIKKCPNYHLIKNKKIAVVDKMDVLIEDVKSSKGKLKGKVIVNQELIKKINNKRCLFLCITEDDVPKKIFKKVGKNNKWKLIDEFSSYLLTNQKINLKKLQFLSDEEENIERFLKPSSDTNKEIVTVLLVKDLIANLPSFF